MVAMTLLQTKFHIPPPRPQLVPRPRLIAWLNEGLHGKLTLVSAPAGFGKTTLIIAWLRGDAEGTRPGPGSSSTVARRTASAPHPSRVAWLSLDEEDNDAVRFLTYIIAALQTVDRRIGESILSHPGLPESLPLNSRLILLLNDIASLFERLYLVLNDYHVIRNTETHQALAFALEHLPPQLHLVIVTREEPPLPLHSLRASGQMNEIGPLRH